MRSMVLLCGHSDSGDSDLNSRVRKEPVLRIKVTVPKLRFSCQGVCVMNRLASGLSFVFLLASCAGKLAATGSGDDAAARGSELQLESIPQAAGDLSISERKPVQGTVPQPGMQDLVDVAVRDLASKLGIETSAIKVLSAESVMWRDSSLGCPTAGNEYMQVLSAGSRIRLEVKEQVFHYHSGDKREPFLCRNPTEPAPSPYGPDAA